MRLNELTEALDNPYPYTWYERSNDTWTAYAELNSERSSDGRDDEDATLRIIADRVSGGDDWDDDERVVPTIWELSFMTGYKTHKTGAGDQFRIFATVVAAFTDWWKQMGSKVNDIDELEFTADKAKDGKSRAVLYARFAKKFAQMTGFNLETKQDSYQDVFTFVNPQSSFAEDSVTEEVSLPQDIFHMKNRLLKVKKITDAMGNRPIMFRSFVYDADRIGKVIKKVTNDSGRKIKTGSNQKQQEVLQKLGVNNPTFANLAAGKHADVRRTSLEDHGVAGLQNIFIPISNEIYYSDAVEDLGMGRSTGGNNISLQSDFDVDKAVASYKKGWPPAGFDNEIIVDTDKYYLLNLQSFLLELTSPDIKDQIKRLKREYDLSYSSNASKNQVDDILKDLFKTKIMTYSNISRWIESVAIPFVDMLGASSVQENFADGKKKGKSTNVLFNLGLAEGYKLQLERDTDMMVLNITDTTTGKRTEVRGKAGYETNGYDKNDKLHQLLDKISKTANISELMNGEPVGINPKHPDGASAKDATTKAFNEAKKASGEKAKMYHWCANMKAGKKK